MFSAPHSRAPPLYPRVRRETNAGRLHRFQTDKWRRYSCGHIWASDLTYISADFIVFCSNGSTARFALRLKTLDVPPQRSRGSSGGGGIAAVPKRRPRHRNAGATLTGRKPCGDSQPKTNNNLQIFIFPPMTEPSCSQGRWGRTGTSAFERRQTSNVDPSWRLHKATLKP